MILVLIRLSMHIANFWEVDSLSFANLDLGYYAIGFLGIACMGHEWCMHGLNFASWGVAHKCIHAQCKLSSSFSSSSEPPHGTTVSEQVYRCSISVNHGQAIKQHAIRKTMLQPDSATITLSYDQTAHFALCWARLRCFTLLQAKMTAPVMLTVPTSLNFALHVHFQLVVHTNKTFFYSLVGGQQWSGVHIIWLHVGWGNTQLQW